MDVSPSYRLVLTQEASDDIFDLYEFYKELKPGLGDSFMDSIGDCLAEIEAHPTRWQFAYSQQENIRRALIRVPPVVILYEVEGNSIYAGRVKDARSNWQLQAAFRFRLKGLAL